MAVFKADVRLKLPKKDWSKGDLPDTKEGWVEYVNDAHDRGLQSRRRQEFQWTINLAYVQGYQHLVYNARSGAIEVPRELRQPLTINRIASFIEARHAKLTKNRPASRVTPASNDLEDLRAAKYSDQSLMHLWRKINMESVYDKVVMMMLNFGTSFATSLWDPYEGEILRELKRSSDGQDLVLNDDGTFAEEDIFLGEVCTRPDSPFNLIPANDSVPEIKDQDYIILRKHQTLLHLYKLYPHLKEKIGPEASEDRCTVYERQVNRMGSALYSSLGTSENKKTDSLHAQALTKCLFMKPNIQYPEGVVAVVTGRELAMIDVFPNDFGDNVYPCVKFSEKETGMHFWTQSTVERLIPIQRAYNRLKQQKAKNAALMANLKWLLAKGSQVAEESLNDEEGEVVEYNPALPEPHPAAIAPMPNYVTELARELIIDFRDVGGQRESSVSPPPNVVAGVAMEIAAEQADEVIGPILSRMARSMKLVANTQLMLMNQEYEEPRKVVILGEAGKSNVQWLSKADFKNHTDVEIEVESLFPDLRGKKRQTLLDLWDRRIITEPQKVIKAFRYGNFDYLLDEDDQVEDQIHLDIQRMKKGKQPEIHPFQNHLLYVRELSKFVQTPEFLRLIPERKQLFIQNIQAHLQFLMASMPGGGEPVAQMNQNSVGSPYGNQVPVGTQGNGA